MNKQCQKCQTYNPENALFCKNCGVKLESEANADKIVPEKQNEEELSYAWILWLVGISIVLLIVVGSNHKLSENNTTDANYTYEGSLTAEANVTATESNITMEANTTEANVTTSETNTTGINSIKPLENRQVRQKTKVKNNSDDYMMQSAQELLGGIDIRIKYNSKGIKIYCLSDKSVCKTEQEVIDYKTNGKNDSDNSDDPKKICEKTAHAAAFNQYLERQNVCGFNRNVAGALAVIYIEMGCEKVYSDKTLARFANEAVQDGKERFKAFGKQEFCDVNMPAYNDLADGFEK